MADIGHTLLDWRMEDQFTFAVLTLNWRPGPGISLSESRHLCGNLFIEKQSHNFVAAAYVVEKDT